MQPGHALDDALESRLRDRIRANSSPKHVPAKILAVEDIPRTINGKIVEIAVRDVMHGRKIRNTDALANPAALDYFRDRPELAK
jgi:acetoacetyl-CoA synthetase